MLLRKKEEIEAWLNQYKIKNYQLIEDNEYGYVVNVNGDVNLNNKVLLTLEKKIDQDSYLFINEKFIDYRYNLLFNNKLKSIDIKFNEINGNFNCSYNNLTTLKGCPEIVYGNFQCNDNKLVSLKYCPKIIKGNIYCDNNELISLEYIPSIINSLYCSNNKLTSLKYFPKKISGFLDISKNFLSIEELKYLPIENNINKIYLSNNNKLNNLQNITNFKELKEKVNEILKIKEEKEKLSNLIIDLNKKKINKI